MNLHIETSYKSYVTNCGAKYRTYICISFLHTNMKLCMYI